MLLGMNARDDFSRDVKNQLALRVAFLCSNPICQRFTTGPRSGSNKSVNIGVAAHITAASPGGPRYDPTALPEYRKGIENGIWLCQVCAKLVDNDTARYSAAVLTAWRATAERDALARLETGSSPHVTTVLEDFEREINPRFGFSFLYPTLWDRHDPGNSDGNWYTHPNDARIEMRAWGNFGDEDALPGEVTRQVELLANEKSFRVVHNTYSGKHVVDYVETEQGIMTTREQIEGYRIVYEFEGNGELTTVIRLIVQYRNAQFSVRCQAPSSLYPTYEQIFLKLVHGIHVIGPNAAPGAR
jgi:hypothetical protein